MDDSTAIQDAQETVVDAVFRAVDKQPDYTPPPSLDDALEEDNKLKAQPDSPNESDIVGKEFEVEPRSHEHPGKKLEVPPPIENENEALNHQAEEFFRAVNRDPALDRREWKQDLVDQGYPLKPLEKLEAETAKKLGVDPPPKLSETASESVQKFGDNLKAELAEKLGSDKIDLRIYEGSKTIYPPKAEATLAQADKLNRLFNDPASIKGSMRLSVRGESGQLKTVYQVKNGKVVKDDLGLSKAQKQTVKKSAKAKPVKAESAKTETDEAVKVETPEQEIERLKSEVATLTDQVAKLEALNSQLKAAQVPEGITKGLDKHKVTMGDRLKNLGNAVKSKLVEKVAPAVQKANEALTQVEAGTVFNSAQFLSRSYGKLQRNGSRQMDLGNDFSMTAKQGEIAITRKSDNAVLFSGNKERSRFTKDASLEELTKLKSLPVKVGKIRHQQEQKLKQAQKTGVGGIKQ